MPDYKLTYIIVTNADSVDEATATAKDCISQSSWEPTKIEMNIDEVSSEIPARASVDGDGWFEVDADGDPV